MAQGDYRESGQANSAKPTDIERRRGMATDIFDERQLDCLLDVVDEMDHAITAVKSIADRMTKQEY